MAVRKGRSRARFGLLGSLLLQGALLASTAAENAAQGPAPALVGMVWDSTASRPLAGAAVYIVGSGLATASDSAGRFVFLDLDGGVYSVSVRHPRFDSLGVEVPPQWRVSVADTGTTHTTLAIPPLSTLLPALCEDGLREGSLVGVVRDDGTGTPLPRATVELSDGEDRWETQTDEMGRYVLCGLPPGVPLVGRADYYGRAPRTLSLVVPTGEPAYREFELRVQLGAPVSGRVTDLETSSPVTGAAVFVESAEGQRIGAITDDEGGFRLRERLDPGTYIVQVQHIAHGTQTRWFSVPDADSISLHLEVRPEALALEGLTVTVNSPARDRLVSGGVRVDVVSREEIEALMGSARDVGDLVREIPGLRVRNDIDPFTMQPRLCVEARRAAGSGCQSVLVVIDGVISHPDVLQAIPPQMIRSIEFVPSVVAGARYGSRSGNGVLEITTMRGAGG